MSKTTRSPSESQKAPQRAPAARNRPSRARLQRLLLVPDVHGVYRHKKAWELMLKAMHWWKPDVTGVLGDFIDAYSLSFFDRDPNRVHQLEDELEDGRALRSQLDDLDSKRKFFCEGNHCERLRRVLMRQAPALFNTVKIEKLLGLEENGWEFHPYRTFTKVGKLNVTHDVGNAGATAHSRARDAFGGNVVIGHTHRAAMEYKGNLRSESHVGLMSGWLGDAGQMDYMHRAKASEWQLAFTIGHMEPDTGIVHLQLIPLIANRGKLCCVVDGKRFEVSL